MEKKDTCGIIGTHAIVDIGGEIEESEDLPCGCLHARAELHTHVQEDAHEHAHTHNHGHEHEHSHDHNHHHHTTPTDIQYILDHLPVPEEVRSHAKAVYDRIAQAEAKAHGVPVEHIHFHEVGSLDAVVDVVGVPCHVSSASRSSHRFPHSSWFRSGPVCPWHHACACSSHGQSAYRCSLLLR